jgi:hypothetical protein
VVAAAVFASTLFGAAGWGITETTAAGRNDNEFLIDGVAYEVPAHWLKHRVDGERMAGPRDLVRLPNELVFEDYDIYVTVPTRDAFLQIGRASCRERVFRAV